MTITLKQICQEALEGIGSIEVPTTIFNNTDDTAIVLKRAAIQTGRELVREYSWQALLTPTTVTTVASTTQYGLPSDFQRFSHLTFWNESEDQQLIGPFGPTGWAELKRGIIADQFRYSFRVAGNYLEISPTPEAGQTIGYDYYSKQYCTDSAGTAQDNWLADTDLARLPEDIFVLGVRYRFLQRKFLPFEEDKADYIKAINHAIFDDTPKANSNLSGIPKYQASNLPDGNFGT